MKLSLGGLVLRKYSTEVLKDWFGTSNDSPVTGLNVWPSGRGAFGSGLVATIK